MSVITVLKRHRVHDTSDKSHQFLRSRKEVIISHIVTIKTEVRDPAAITAACRRLGYAGPVHGKTRLFTAEATGHAVQLPGWRYPAVCDTITGTIAFDNYNGAWGEQKLLDQFLQAYAVEKAKLEARKNGHSVSEQSLADGSIKLTVHV